MKNWGNRYDEEAVFEGNLKGPNLDRGFGDQLIIE